MLNEVKRQLLLSAITELWVEYLTKVEGLRVSIGLEAYAQRDPLVQYKGQASELFQQLLSDVRAAVIGRVFAYQPRRMEITPTETSEAGRRRGQRLPQSEREEEAQAALRSEPSPECAFCTRIDGETPTAHDTTASPPR